MKLLTSTFVAAAVLSAVPHASAQALSDSARKDAVVQQALRTYQQGLNDLNPAPSGVTQPGGQAAEVRELRLEEAVAIALEKNLDIQIARLEPQSVDFLVAGFRNLYRPLASSTVGLRDQFQLPTSSLNGGTKVNNGTTTYNFGLSQNVNKWGGNFTVNWTNSRVETSNTFSTFNPSRASS